MLTCHCFEFERFCTLSVLSGEWLSMRGSYSSALFKAERIFSVCPRKCGHSLELCIALKVIPVIPFEFSSVQLIVDRCVGHTYCTLSVWWTISHHGLFLRLHEHSRLRRQEIITSNIDGSRSSRMETEDWVIIQLWVPYFQVIRTTWGFATCLCLDVRVNDLL